VFLAKATIFVALEPRRRGLLVLCRRVIAPLALGAGKRDYLSHGHFSKLCPPEGGLKKGNKTTSSQVLGKFLAV